MPHLRLPLIHVDIESEEVDLIEWEWARRENRLWLENKRQKARRAKKRLESYSRDKYKKSLRDHRRFGKKEAHNA